MLHIQSHFLHRSFYHHPTQGMKELEIMNMISLMIFHMRNTIAAPSVVPKNGMIKPMNRFI
ncbi:MAG: hypothetical protein IKN25_07885, partial [Spirochaetales bacterium]|nr:hypothetical protein [Spirochaetales bacterium]